MALIHVSELPPGREVEALGLVRLATGKSEGEWQSRLLAPGAQHQGVLCATALNGTLLGLAAYRIDPLAPLGRSLRVTLFAAFELLGKGATRTALRNALHALAGDLGCGMVLYPEESPGLTANDPCPA